DGAAVVAGAATGGALAARYDGRGALDCGYATRGRTLAFGANGFDPGTDGAAAAALQPDGKLVLAGRRAAGGLLLGRLLGGPSSAPPRAGAPRLVTLAARSIGRGRGYAYGLVDGGCRAVDVRFTVRGASGPAVSTHVQRVLGRFGPQVVCAPLRGLRVGGRYRIRIEASPRGGAHGASRVLRVPARAGRALAQEGCP
ncbi:MAG: hypothetical protein QOJ35_3656, partial [Solirubrobacteraceae bacterium]|nr:hypothetical protein [Solirubrobacteraceae bacterium]